MKIDWLSFMIGCAVMMVLMNVFIHYTWKPLLGESQKQTMVAFVRLDQAHARVDSAQKLSTFAIAEAFKAKGHEVPQSIQEIIDEYEIAKEVDDATH